jgi:hypothetical protein
MSKTKLFLAFFICIAGHVSAQIAKSPFSAFGVGDFVGTSLTHNQGMAGVGISNPQYWFMNNQNPAMLVFNNFTTFEGGLFAERLTLKNATTSEKNTNGNMGYLALSFPIKRLKWVNSIVLSPYSSSNYKFSYSDVIDGTSATTRVTEEGSGGLNRVSWSHGIALHNYVSIGGRMNYLFSSIERTYANVLEETDQTFIFQPSIYQRFHFSDFSFTGALSFHVDSLFRRNYKLNIGAVYDMKADVNTQLYETMERRNSGGVTDSTTLKYNAQGTTTLPPRISGGISFGRGDNWMLGVDVAITDYSLYKQSFDMLKPQYQKGRKLSAGFELTPDPASLSNYLKRVTYRTGVSYEEMPYLINGKPLKDFGINFGFSTPVSRVSSLDMAFRWGKRGTVSENGVEENYFKIYFGVTFNDQWFIKRRFD